MADSYPNHVWWTEGDNLALGVYSDSAMTGMIAGLTIKVKGLCYTPLLTLSDLTSQLPIPRRYHRFVIDYVLARLAKSDEEVMFRERKWEFGLKKAKKSERKGTAQGVSTFKHYGI